MRFTGIWNETAPNVFYNTFLCVFQCKRRTCWCVRTSWPPGILSFHCDILFHLFCLPRCAKSRAEAPSAGNHLYTPPCPQSWAEQPFRWAVRMTHSPTHWCGCAQKDNFHLTQNPHRGPITCAVIGSLRNVGGGSQKSLPFFFFSMWLIYTQRVELSLYTRKAHIPRWCLETVLFGHPNRSEDRQNWPN